MKCTWWSLWHNRFCTLQWGTESLFIFSKDTEIILISFKQILDTVRCNVGLGLIHFDPGEVLLVPALQVISSDWQAPIVSRGLPSHHHWGGGYLFKYYRSLWRCWYFCRVLESMLLEQNFVHVSRMCMNQPLMNSFLTIMIIAVSYSNQHTICRTSGVCNSYSNSVKQS